MSDYLGDFPTAATFSHVVDLWASGVLMPLVGGTLSAYKDNNDTPTGTGVALADTSYGGIDGLHRITIDCADTFYAAGSEVRIVITAGTLDSVSQVGRVLFSFSVERTGGILALLKHATFGLSAIESLVDDIGAAGAGLTAVPWNAAWDAEVQSEVQDALEANNLDHLAGTPTGIPLIPAGTYLDQMMDDGVAVYDRATDSLQAQRDQAALIKAKTDNLPAAPAAVGSAMTLTSGERDAVAAALLDLANGVETGKSVRKALQAMAAVLAGDVTGAGTATELFKALGNASTTRVTVPVDENGNRSGVTVS